MDKQVKWICRECKSEKFVIKRTKKGEPIIICSLCGAKHTLKPDGRLYIVTVEGKK